MLKIRRHKQFIKDNLKTKITDEQFEKFTIYLNLLIKSEPLPIEARDHELKGNWKGFREFHLGGDLLVIYLVESDTLKLIRIGSHSQLFK